ncbi:MAG: hypothetical protein ABW047_17370 [Nitrospiraceae bacterium]
MTDGKTGWNPAAWRGYPERVGQWWRLTKGSRAVSCDIWTRPLGGELRCEVDGEMFGHAGESAAPGSARCVGKMARGL